MIRSPLVPLLRPVLVPLLNSPYPVAAAPPPAPGGVTWDADETSGLLTLTEGDLLATGEAGINNGVGTRTTSSKTTGKWYLTIQVHDGFGSHSGDISVGLVPANEDITPDDNGGSAPNVQVKLISGAIPVTNDDCIMVVVDEDLGYIWFKYSGGYVDGDAEAGTEPTLTFTPNTAMCGCALLYAESGSPSWVRLGATAGFAAPAGFTAWGS